MARTANRFNALHDENGPRAAGIPHKSYRVALYARLSDDHDDRKSGSIDNQLGIMKNYIRKNPELADCREYADSGFTGTNFDRPEFRRMMDDVRNGKINCIIVKDLSRFGRDYLETTNYIEVILPFLEVRLISVNDSFDTERHDSNKELEVALKNLANDMYAKDISRKITSAKISDRERGKRTGGSAPYGYRIDHGNALGRYVIDDAVSGIVRRIFTMASGGVALTEIAGIFQSEGLNSPAVYRRTGHVYHMEGDPEGAWLESSVSRITRNEAYIGKLVQGKSRKRLYNGEKEHKVAREEWSVVENAHEPIVSEELFCKVRGISQERWDASGFAQEHKRAVPKKPNKYAGLIRCGVCGRPLNYISNFGKSTNTRETRYYSFCCGYRLLHGDDASPNISERKLDKAVLAEIKAQVKRLTDKKETVEKCREAFRARVRENEKLAGNIRNRIGKMERELFLKYQDYGTGAASREEYISFRDVTETEIGQRRKQLAKAEEAVAGARKGMERNTRIVKSLYRANGAKALDESLLHLLVERIVVHPGQRLEIAWTFREAVI